MADELYRGDQPRTLNPFDPKPEWRPDDPLAARSVWQLCVDSVRLYVHTLPQNFPVVLVLLAAALVPYFASNAEPFIVGDGELNALQAVRSLGLSVASMVVQFFVYATMTWQFLQIDKGVMSVQDATAHVVRRALPLFVASVVATLWIVGGFMLLIIPGLVLIISLWLTDVVVLAEDESPLAAIKRSRQLMLGHWWRGATIMGVMTLPLFIFGTYVSVDAALSALDMPTQYLSLEEVQTQMRVSQTIEIISAVINALYVPIYAAFGVEVYRDTLGAEQRALAKRTGQEGPATP